MGKKKRDVHEKARNRAGLVFIIAMIGYVLAFINLGM